MPDINGIDFAVLVLAALGLVFAAWAFRRTTSELTAARPVGLIVRRRGVNSAYRAPGRGFEHLTELDWSRLPSGVTRRPFDRCWPGTSEPKRSVV